MPDRRLVITADDFGLHPAVNSAVEIAHRRGALTAASLMIGAPAAAEAVAIARTMPDLRVGLHIVLTDGWPVLPAKKIPNLTRTDGSFRTDIAATGMAIYFSREVQRDMAAEIAAQFAAFAATGLTLDHVNAHKHFHLHPTIAAAIVKIGRDFGVRSARIPVEPSATLARVEPGQTTWAERLTASWARRAGRRLRRAGLTTTDQVFGLRWTGHMTSGRLSGLIGALPSGLTEVYLHPATKADFPGSAPGYDYSGELAALTSDEVLHALAAANLRRGGFQDLV